MKFRMLLEHTIAVNLSYSAIPNLTLDLNDGHFSKCLPEYTCLNISVSKSLGKMILVYKYTFSGQSFTKKDNNKYVNLPFDFNF